MEKAASNSCPGVRRLVMIGGALFVVGALSAALSLFCFSGSDDQLHPRFGSPLVFLGVLTGFAAAGLGGVVAAVSMFALHIDENKYPEGAAPGAFVGKIVPGICLLVGVACVGLPTAISLMEASDAHQQSAAERREHDESAASGAQEARRAIEEQKKRAQKVVDAEQAKVAEVTAFVVDLESADAETASQGLHSLAECAKDSVARYIQLLPDETRRRIVSAINARYRGHASNGDVQNIYLVYLAMSSGLTAGGYDAVKADFVDPKSAEAWNLAARDLASEQPEALKKLLKNGFDPFGKTSPNGQSIFEAAIGTTPDEGLRAILKHSPSPIPPATLAVALQKAISLNLVNNTRDLLEGGADPNRPFDDKTLPLNDAVQNNRVDLVALLMEFKADPNARDAKQNCAFDLIYCVPQRDQNKVRDLLNKGR